MLRVVANTLSNKLYMYGNISFHSVKPLFNLRDRLRFINFVYQRFLFFFTRLSFLRHWRAHQSSLMSAPKILFRCFRFYPPQGEYQHPVCIDYWWFLFQTTSLKSYGPPNPSLTHALLLISIFFKSNKTHRIEFEANWLSVYGLFWVSMGFFFV